jgi:hypothetical protein
MKIKKYIFLSVINMFLILLISGCVGYGKIRLQPRDAEKMTIQKLMENWPDYNVYYSGVSIDLAGAIMFDPKDDERELVGHKWWDQVKDPEKLSEIIFWINTYYSNFYPRVWRILGPDDQFYGYMYTGRHHVLIKVLDERTLWVDEMVLPPDIHDEGDDKRETMLRLGW